jgi:hypothetical protein
MPRKKEWRKIEREPTTSSQALKSLLAGATLLAVSFLYALNPAPNDSNDGWWLYALSIWVLGVYQVVLVREMFRTRAPGLHYTGLVLSLLSMVVARNAF